MTALLTRGQAGVLGAGDITVSVHHSARIDLAALLLGGRSPTTGWTLSWR